MGRFYTEVRVRAGVFSSMDLKLLLTECIEMTHVLHQDRGRVTFDVAVDGEERFFRAWVDFGDTCMYQESGGTMDEAVAGLHRRLRSQCTKQRDALAAWTRAR